MSSADLCLLIGELRPLISKVIIERHVLIDVILVLLLHCLCFGSFIVSYFSSQSLFAMCISPSVPGIASSVLCRFGLVDMNSFSLFTPQFIFLLKLLQLILLGTVIQVAIHDLLEFEGLCPGSSDFQHFQGEIICYSDGFSFVSDLLLFPCSFQYSLFVLFWCFGYNVPCGVSFLVLSFWCSVCFLMPEWVDISLL